jgi:hypothetical protein
MVSATDENIPTPNVKFCASVEINKVNRKPVLASGIIESTMLL